MRHKLGVSVIFGMVSILFLGTPAVGDSGVVVHITNDGVEDIVVTVYDTTLGPNAVVLPHARINGFTTVPVSVAADETGRANVSWTAVSADPNDRKCGHADTVGLGDSASITVRADSSCSDTQPRRLVSSAR